MAKQTGNALQGEMPKKEESPEEFNARVEREWNAWRKEQARKRRYKSQYVRDVKYWKRRVRGRYDWNQDRLDWPLRLYRWFCEYRKRRRRASYQQKAQSFRYRSDRRGRGLFQPRPIWERERILFCTLIGLIGAIAIVRVLVSGFFLGSW